MASQDYITVLFWTFLVYAFLFCNFSLIPNLGYISEASASLVDRSLQLNIIPRTEIVELASPSFYYGPIDRKRARTKGYPTKVGSLQLFLKGYKDASQVLKLFHTNPLSDRQKIQFQTQFERLVILDYIIRNTDRGDDNWMIFQSNPGEAFSSQMAKVYDERRPILQHSNNSSHDSLYNSPTPLNENWTMIEQPQIYIAAIDNGLAFPFKHPDNWRSYPYGWASLPACRVAFSQETINKYLPILQDSHAVDSMLHNLKSIAQFDPDFDNNLFQRQISVTRGQIYNVVQVLQEKGRPFDLLNKPLLAIDEENEPIGESVTTRTKKKIINFVKKQPCFSSW
jgi:phosphatidylinositol 4-kinase type 2